MRQTLVSLLIIVALTACQADSGSSTIDVKAPSEEGFVATDEPARVGREHFVRGNYGLAERYFQAAVERKAGDGDAWVGLAASYDQLARFDLADRAYDHAMRIKGETAQILNNRGFSYLLRGDVAAANRLFARARAMAPQNPVITNNIQILRSATN